MTRRIVPGAALLLSVIAILVSRVALLHRPHGPRLPSVALALPVRHARLFALSFDSLAADLLWVRFIQDVPMAPADEVTGAALASELKTITALDPTFRAPYVHGATLLSVLGNQPCSALDVLEDGITRFPADWHLSFEAGYECFSELGDTLCAERHMTRAASIPGSPRWLPGLVARFLAANKRTEASIEYLRNALAHTTDPRLTAQFQERLKQALLTVELDRLDAAIREYRARHGGSLPASLSRLVDEGLTGAIPAVDPAGGELFLGPDGRARSSSGLGKLHPHRVDGGEPATAIERFLPERTESRVDELVGHPAWMRFETDRVATRGGILDFAAQGIAFALRFADDPQALHNFREFLARTIMAHDVERMKKTQIALMQAGTSGTPSIAQIAAEAGVPDHDPFGSKYRLDAKGIAAAAADRHPMVNVRGRGAASCR